MRRKYIRNMAAGLAACAALTLLSSQGVSAAAGTKAATDSSCEAEEEAASKKQENTDSAKIAKGISIEGVDVSGKTPAQAKEAVKEYIAKYDDVTFTLRGSDENHTTEASGADVGLIAKNADVAERAAHYGSEGNLLERYEAKQDIAEGRGKDFHISLTADNQTVRNYLESEAGALSIPVVNNGLKRTSGGFEYVPGTKGSSVDCGLSATKIADYIDSDWNGKDCSIDLVMKEVDPEGDEKQLSQVKDVLGTYTTSFSGSTAGRIANIRNGTSKINGQIVYPGEVLSVHDLCAPFTAENGYSLAGVYQDGDTVDDFGGGLCQVSSTLYNAVIRAELEIVQRQNHSMTVHYVKPSEDAAIAGDYKDFRFRNNQKIPVYIEGYISGSSLTFTVYGLETRDPGHEVSFESEVLEEIEPKKEYTIDNSLPAGSITRTQGSQTGLKAQLIKVVKENGVEKSRSVFNKSSYMAKNAKYSVGTAGLSAAGVASVRAAAKSGDEAAIRAAVAAAKEAQTAQPAQDSNAALADPNAAGADPNAAQPAAPASPAAPAQPQQ